MGLLGEIEAAAELIYRHLGPTPEYCWPLICERAGTEVWVKHENHTPIGAFKLRGGLVYLDDLMKRAPETRGVIAATRGNHGQSVAYAARRAGIEAVVVAPHGNSAEKNRAMRALGAELIEHGEDFNAALERAEELAAARGLHAFPSYHPLLVRGVATYGLELLRAVPDLDTVYVPIGLGSGINGVISARDALGLKTRVVGVVAERAAAYALSFEAGRPVSTETCDTLADGVSVRIPDAEALAVMLKGAERVVTVSEDEIEAAMRAYYPDTHNLAEGAGAAPLAALLKEKEIMAGRKAAVILSGGNVDTELTRRVLAQA
ncbi:MAG: threonine dehydratase [Proteobacteria bacterium]|nr:threonine dehydratase [Pseudomonadota bacterium]